MAEGCAGDAAADDSAALSDPDGPGRNASNAAPAHAPKTTTTANSISDDLSGLLATTRCGKAESDIGAPARMA